MILGKHQEPLAQQHSGKSQKTWTFSDTTMLASNIAPWIFLLQIWWIWQWDIVGTIIATVWPDTRLNYVQNWILEHMLLIVMPFSVYALEVLKWNSSHCIPCTMLVSMHQEILLRC
jgi:hypothetical protein